jgi:hypothetical protein
VASSGLVLALVLFTLGLGQLAYAQNTTPAPAWQVAISGSAVSGTSETRAVATDAAGNAYVTGFFTGTLDFGVTRLTGTSSPTLFVAKWNATTTAWDWAASGRGVGVNASARGCGIAVNGTSVYVTGFFTGGLQVVGQTLANNGLGTSTDMFVAKYIDNGLSYSNGWAISGGGGGSDTGVGIAVEGANVYVTGNVQSNAGATIAGQALPGTGSLTSDVFVAKYIDNGASFGNGWAISGGGTSNDDSYGVVVSGTSIYITGTFTSAAGATIAGQMLSGVGTGTDVFVAKYTDQGGSAANGWATSGGGPRADVSYGIAANGSNVYITGSYQNSGTFAGQALTGLGVGTSTELFVAKYFDQGTSVANGWAASGGGRNNDAGCSIAVNGNKVYVTGSYEGSDSGNVIEIAGQQMPNSYDGGFVQFEAKYLDNGTSFANGWVTIVRGAASSPTGSYGTAVRGRTVYAAGLVDSYNPQTSQTSRFNYLRKLVDFAPPTITSFSPASGRPGATVVLTGTNFTGATLVSFNGTATQNLVVNSPTQLTVSVPNGATSGLLTVTTQDESGTSTNNFTVEPALVTTWTGARSNDWFTASNWTLGAPTATFDAVVPVVSTVYPVIAAGTANAHTLTIAGGATLSQSGGTLNLTGDLANSGTFAPTGGTVTTSGGGNQTLGSSSPLVLQSLTIGAGGAALSDALVVNSGGVVLGTTTVQRAIDPTLNPGLGYRHLSSPVANSTVADLATPSFTPVVNPTYNTSATPTAETPFPTVFGYDDSRYALPNNLNAFDKGFFSPASLSEPLLVGRGYAVNRGTNDSPDFQGVLNNGNVVLTIPIGSAGYQLLGNPYPSPLDYSLVMTVERSLLEAAIYVYSSTSQYAGRYRTYVNGIGNPILPVGQAYFVRAASSYTPGTMIYRNRQRAVVPTGTPVQRTAETRPLVQLTLQDAGNALADETTIYFEKGATSGFDALYDAEKLTNPTGLNCSSSQNGRFFSINGQPELSNSQRVVPLAMGVPAAGVYTLTASQLLNLSTVPVYLRDLLLGTLIDLHQQPVYQFTVSNAAVLNTTRFELVFSPQQALATVPIALAQQVAVYPNPAKAQVTVDLPLSLSRQPITVALFDAVGRVVYQQVLPVGLATHVLPLTDVTPGMYSLRLTTGQGTIAKKLLVD